MSDLYNHAGVDVHAGYEAVSRMKRHIDRTKTPGVMGAFGGFGGLFDLSGLNVKEPVLVSGTDGVGTKLMLAFETDKHDTIGIDAVAMCANDIITCGAKPLFFLDYIACGKLDPSQIEVIVSGVAEGCVRAGCALIGGETAEMPGMYKENEYDIAGFCVGVAEKSDLITGEDIAAGDVLVGLFSSGVHSNGFSLVRKIINDQGLSLSEKYPGLAGPLGETLLIPTRIYVKPIISLMERIRPKAMAHITGGGFYENIPRILPQGCGVSIRRGTWEIPPIFSFLQNHGNIADSEMYRVFNMGIGMVLIFSREEAESALTCLRQSGEDAEVIGEIGEVISGESVTFV